MNTGGRKGIPDPPPNIFNWGEGAGAPPPPPPPRSYAYVLYNMSVANGDIHYYS